MMESYFASILRLSKVGNEKTKPIGTAFKISPGTLITALHIFESLQHDQVVVRGVPGIAKIRIKEVIPHEKADIALLKLELPIDNVPDLKMTKTVLSEIKYGELLYIIGYPASEDIELRQTNYNGLDTTTVPALVCNNFLGRGMSGGPIINSDHKIIGVCISRDTNRNRSYGVPIDLFSDFLPKDCFENPQKTDRIPSVNSNDPLEEKHKLIGLNREIFQFYRKSCEKDRQDIVSFYNSFLSIKIEDVVGKLLFGGKHHIGFEGKPGVGITSFLSLLCAELAQKEMRIVYINIGAIEFEKKEKVKEIIKETTEAIVAEGDSENNKYVLFIDGIDERIVTRRWIYKEILEHTKYMCSTILGMRSKGKGQFEMLDEIVSCKSLTKNQFKTFYSQLSNQLQSAIGVSKVVNNLDKYPFNEVDLFEIYQLREIVPCETEVEARTSYTKIISKLIRKEIRRFSAEANYKDIKRCAAKVAFDDFLRSYQKKKQKKYCHEIGELETAVAFNLALMHESVRNLLIAEYIVEFFLNLNELSEDEKRNASLPYVYPYAINFHCRNIILKDDDFQPNLVDAIQNVIKDPNVDGYMKAHGCYMLGRVSSELAKSQAKLILLEIIKNQPINIKEFKSNFLETHEGYNFTEETITAEYKKHKMVLRSAYISLSYLGEEDCVIEFCKLLVTKEEWDMFNRGFHLEYYGDKKYLPSRPLESMDTLGACNKTTEKLRNRLLEDSTSIKRYVDLQTYLSLIRYRVIGKKATKRQVEQAMALISNIPKEALKPIMRTFVSQVEFELTYGFPFSVKIFSELYGVKFIKRKGWLDRGFLFGETVADHTYGAMVIAKYLLPESLGDKYLNYGYDKEKIVGILFLHDWGEGRCGDSTPNDKDRNVKKECEKGFFDDFEICHPQISNYTKKGWPNLCACKDSWKKYVKKNDEDINHIIAHNIDKLENYIMLHFYENLSWEFDEKEIAKWKNDLKTDLHPVLKAVLDYLDEYMENICKLIIENLNKLQPKYMAHIAKTNVLV